MSDVSVIVATHKSYDMPEDPVYIPVLVGAAKNKADVPYVKDNTGDNISEKNSMYCELTGLYWAWKNLDADCIGLVHYRRLFKGASGKAISGEEIRKILQGYRLIVPSKRRYYIEKLDSHYIHTHGDEELIQTRRTVEEKYPSYIASYDKIMGRTWGYMFNMFIMPRDLLDPYCTWLFDILDDVVAKVGTGDRSAFEARYPGRLSELLFNCWLEQKLSEGIIKKEDIAEVPLLNLGDEKFLKKAFAFLRAKFFGKKQEKSF